MKDETTPTQEVETTASSEIINYLKAKVDLNKTSGYSKTARIDYPKPYPTDYMVGVFKTTTCGNSPEFIYLMNCEDGGWTNISNPYKEAFATIVDHNGNIEFHMCVVRGANFGGFALALGPIYDITESARADFWGANRAADAAAFPWASVRVRVAVATFPVDWATSS